MQNLLSTEERRKGSRRQVWLGIALVACVVLGLLSIKLAVTYLRDHSSPKLRQIDLQSPTHYFIPSGPEGGDVLSCDFERNLDRDESHNQWSLPPQPCSLRSGWSNPSSRGVMAAAKHSKLSFSTHRSDWTHLVLRIKAPQHPAGDRDQTMEIRLNRQQIGSVVVPTKWSTLSVALPPGVLREGVNNISLRFAYRVPHVPASQRRSVRPLYAVHLREIALTRSSSHWGSRLRLFRQFLAKFFRPTVPPTTQVYDRDLQRYVLPLAGTLIMPISIPDSAKDLEIEIRSATAEGLRDGQITLNLQGIASGVLVSAHLPDFDANGSGSVRGVISVASLAGETAICWIDIEEDIRGLPLEIGEPRIIQAPHTAERPSEQSSRGWGIDAHRPDIVLITLDAARPHHFSCYGYHRPTTPNIGRLAEESLVFTNAFALVPNTRRSVPTMITGLSFLNHQVTANESALSEAANTLAEYLAEAGYRTACFTASPNNARASGADQGYEEFFELWNEVPRTRSSDPHYLSARVIEWLTTVDDSRPLHLQLHFVPPHLPYDPAPEFDLFSDPLYEGDCDGSKETILGIDKGKLLFDAADMKQLIALYDGNLRAGDDAVGEVLSALQRRSQWRDTVVLVTSDHGEAFYEHRRMGHNNTVYDEMLRVPFILRLPGEINPNDFDLDRLVTLADIVPTLLPIASVESTARVDGTDLLNTSRFGHRIDDRFFIAQTAHGTPTMGLRSRRFKLVFANSGQGELYDLVEDPGELNNLCFSRPELFAGLGMILTRTLLEPPSLGAGAELSELPKSDLEMLEALGYVE